MAVAERRERREQTLQIERFLAGRSSLTGMFQDRFGNLRRQFEADVHGTWDGRALTLVEDFVYDDGETEQRTWQIEKLDDRRYRGHANGVIGAAEGEVRGRVFTWRYRFALPVGGRIWKVRFNDWLFLQNDEVLINRAEVTRFGLRIGQLVCVFRRAPTAFEGEPTKMAVSNTA